jgi:hypothetical protein
VRKLDLVVVVLVLVLVTVTFITAAVTPVAGRSGT